MCPWNMKDYGSNAYSPYGNHVSQTKYCISFSVFVYNNACMGGYKECQHGQDVFLCQVQSGAYGFFLGTLLSPDFFQRGSQNPDQGNPGGAMVDKKEVKVLDSFW